MASISGLGGGDLGNLMSQLRNAGGTGGAAGGAGAAGGGGAMGAATQQFGSALDSALRGDVSGTMNQLNQLASTDPNKLYEGGVLGKASGSGAARAMMSGDSGSVAGLVDSMSRAIQSRLETTEAAKKTAETDVQTLVTGGDIDLHNVILASERAGL